MDTHVLTASVQSYNIVHAYTWGQYSLTMPLLLLCFCPSSMLKGEVSLDPNLGFTWKNAWPLGTKQNHRHRAWNWTGAGLAMVRRYIQTWASRMSDSLVDVQQSHNYKQSLLQRKEKKDKYQSTEKVHRGTWLRGAAVYFKLLNGDGLSLETMAP